MKMTWVRVMGSGEIPAGSRVILDYRINGYLTNGVNNQIYTYSDACRALSDRECTVEYSQ